MDLLTELGQDMVDLWLNYWPRYLIGIRNTVILAIVATALGCLIGFICGILNTIPYSKPVSYTHLSSAPSGTSRAGLTISSAAAPAVRATRARPGST